MKRRNLWRNLLRVGLSLVTLFVLLRLVGWREISTVLRSADLRLLLLAWLLFLMGVLVRTFRWRALLLGLGLHQPLGRLLHLYLVGGFFNTFLPTGLGGDVVRVLELGEDGRRTVALGTVFLDRLTGILSLMALGLMALPLAPGLESWLAGTVAAICGGGLVGGVLLLQGRLLRRLTAWLPAAFSLDGEGVLAQVYAAVTGCGPRAVWQALLLSTLFNLLNVVVVWLCGRAVGMTVELAFYFVAVPLLSLTLLAPISVGGLGLRDWVAQPLFGSVGVPPERIAVMTLATYAVTAATGLPGGVLYLLSALRKTRQRREDEGTSEV